jgi:hypothetical protein
MNNNDNKKQKKGGSYVPPHKRNTRSATPSGETPNKKTRAELFNQARTVRVFRVFEILISFEFSNYG